MGVPINLIEEARDRFNDGLFLASFEKLKLFFKCYQADDNKDLIMRLQTTCMLTMGLYKEIKEEKDLGRIDFDDEVV